MYDACRDCGSEIIADARRNKPRCALGTKTKEIKVIRQGKYETQSQSEGTS